MSNNKDLEDFLDNIPGLTKPRTNNNSTQQQSNDEIDVSSMLQQRIMGRMMQQQGNGLNNNNQQIPPVQYQQNYEMIFLREGFQYYKAVPAQESPMPIAMYAGPIANVTGKEFINKGARKYYVVEGHNPIDLSNPDYSKMKILYAVEAPWIGTILVPENALIKQGKTNRQLLKG